jgi:hypothetical protein
MTFDLELLVRENGRRGEIRIQDTSTEVYARNKVPFT